MHRIIWTHIHNALTHLHHRLICFQSDKCRIRYEQEWIVLCILIYTFSTFNHKVRFEGINLITTKLGYIFMKFVVSGLPCLQSCKKMSLFFIFSWYLLFLLSFNHLPAFCLIGKKFSVWMDWNSVIHAFQQTYINYMKMSS